MGSNSICRSHLSFILVNQIQFYSLSLMTLAFWRGNIFQVLRFLSFWLFFFGKAFRTCYVVEMLQCGRLLSSIKLLILLLSLLLYIYFNTSSHSLFQSGIILAMEHRLASNSRHSSFLSLPSAIWNYTVDYYFIITVIIINLCIMLCLSFIFHCFDKILWKIAQWEEVYLACPFRSFSITAGKITTAGEWWKWSYGTHNQEQDGEQCSSCFLLCSPRSCLRNGAAYNAHAFPPLLVQ